MKWRWLGLAALSTLPLVASMVMDTRVGATETNNGSKISGEPVPSLISCTRHRVFPKNNGPFQTSIVLHVAQWQIIGKRLTTLHPGQETFEGKADPDGNITLSGMGGWEGRSEAWRYAFKGQMQNSGNTILKGQMIQRYKGVEKITRECTLTFLLDPSDLRQRLASPNFPRTNEATAANTHDVAILKQQQAAADQQRQRDQEKLTGLQSNQQAIKSDLDATSTRVSDVQKGLILPADERPSDWTPRIAAIPVQQQQFCQIINRYHDQLIEAQNAHNALARKTSYQERRRDFLALLPSGQFENWVMRVVQVDDVNGNAGVVLQPPCRVILANSLCRGENEKIGAILPGSPQYRELERVKADDFVVVSGKLPYVGEKDDAEATSSRTGQAKMQIQPICVDQQGQDTFAADISYIARMN